MCKIPPEDLVKLAAEAGFSPTFINWFESDPARCLNELWQFWSMKERIMDYLEGNNDDPGDIYKGMNNLVKEQLF